MRFKNYKEVCEYYEKQYKDLLERSKTEYISFIEIIKPLQMIHNYSFIEFKKLLNNRPTSENKY
jgi:hypothetical protein